MCGMALHILFGYGSGMIFFQITALICCFLFIAWKTKEALVDVIPVAVSLLVLVLYGLAFVNGLLWWDYLAVAAVAAAVVGLVRMQKEKRRALLSFCIGEIKKPGSIIAIFLLTAVPMLASGKAVSWWDDYNFWATDAKAIYYLNGFAEKYQNVAPEFGDYPPATQMMKWWFLHFSPEQFEEGLLFSGYYFMNLAYLVPLLRDIKKRNPVVMLLGAAALWLFPTAVEVFWCDGCCADLTMAVIYGCFLMAVADSRGHSRLFYYGRQALLLMVLVLCKNTGFMWVAFGLIFAYGYHIFILRKKEYRGLLAITVLPVVTESSWLLFCLINRRVAKLTGAVLHMATGSMNIPEVKTEMVEAFVTAFISYPLHRWKTFAIDVSPLLLYLLLLVFVGLLCKKGTLSKRQGWYLGLFLAGSGLFFYGVNLMSHLTIFAVETQYLEPFGMVSSIERYGAPFTIGGLYLLGYFAMKYQKAGLIICMAFVFLTADYESGWRALYGYRSTAPSVWEERKEIVDEEAEAFLAKVGAGQSGNGKRVLYLRDISDVSWVRNTYISFEAAPVSVMYGNVDGSTMGSEEIQKLAAEAHAGYLYVEKSEGTEEILKELTGGEPFEYSALYEIQEENGQIYLKKE